MGTHKHQLKIMRIDALAGGGIEVLIDCKICFEVGEFRIISQEQVWKWINEE